VIEKTLELRITRDTELGSNHDGTRLIIEPVREGEAKGQRRRVGGGDKARDEES